ncbi:hypothetical protein W1080910_044 [Cyanophage S-RIM12 isolate W1_08_0910]|uniref:Uncharacterized protein n=4 Tax=Brizovirus TaxID=2733098 RepID=A0A1D7SZT9_9CAUD|nr:hypothetical protein HOQ65_gp192 [Cyanophage S-RIM12 isolate RW_06_0310]YP_009779453.1 hypothetical protein HOQ66_gp192 [Cyanophage S-RIM12 isolate W1_08_0910]AOO15318.1 hypothetical protein Np150310_044 [Cyanophage S-RIM12_Np_15_0310]AOO15958.1 hypothetical protein RW040310_044 [Cyanophage S-RIM12_RW_04_0310]AOO18751.1 hypothetical protein W1120610_045 [Cyanophage S-RIM12_W1_12_0610]AOO19178.1 hypothetical protein WH050310_044 [Cyanophage S-RIM12_WH_05_0310]AOO19391.1 hypothetical protein
MAEASEGTILLANQSVISEQKAALIVHQDQKKTMTISKPKETKGDENSTLNLTMALDGIETDLEELEFDDYSEIDYDLDFTVQY